MYRFVPPCTAHSLMFIGVYVCGTNQYKPVQAQSNTVVQRYNTLWVYRCTAYQLPGHEPMRTQAKTGRPASSNSWHVSNNLNLSWSVRRLARTLNCPQFFRGPTPCPLVALTISCQGANQGQPCEVVQAFLWVACPVTPVPTQCAHRHQNQFYLREPVVICRN